MDCSVQPTRHSGVFLVTTTDFFYPNIEDPYIQGKIGCANVLSDLYAMGVSECDSMLMLIAASLDMTEEERTIVTKEMIRGFNDLAIEAGTKVTGGQTVKNPWPIIGGVAESVCMEAEFIRPEHAQPGDVIVLTKPLGTQVAVNAFQAMNQAVERWDKIKDIITPEQVRELFDRAKSSMARLNRTGAILMHKYAARGATDVTGFGIIGHLDNLAKNQKAEVQMVLHTLPCIRYAPLVNSKLDFRLTLGYSAETSGGLLIVVSKENAQPLIDEITQIDGCPAWIVADVVAGPRMGVLAESVTVVEV